MSGADIAGIVGAVIGTVVIVILASRSGRYIRTGRWFR